MGPHINPELAADVHDSHRTRADDYGMTWARYLAALAGWLDGTEGPPPGVMLAALRADDDADAYDAAREAAEDPEDVATDGGRGGSTIEATAPGEPAGGELQDVDGPDESLEPSEDPRPAWAADVGLTGTETEVIEHFADVLATEIDGHAPAERLSYEIPVEHMGDVGIEDVEHAIADHPAIAEPETGVYVAE